WSWTGGKLLFRTGRSVRPQLVRSWRSAEEHSMPILENFMVDRRAFCGAGGAAVLVSGLTWPVASLGASQPEAHQGADPMNFISANDGAQIFYKDWGPRDAQPLVFHHGWPLTADEWDNQLLFFLAKGYRVIAHDRRGHGRSTQTDKGNEMD